MGAWGTGFLENDAAADAAATFTDAVDGGKSAAEAFALVRAEFPELLEDVDEGPMVLVGLAWLAAERGDVPDALRTEALGVIKSGAGLEGWLDPEDRAKREALERTLASRLSAP
ncbi:MAG: DUF4259 domain-containing protein [Chloroflexota bacterium]